MSHNKGEQPQSALVGQRFSHAYLNRGEPISDSARMRRRISALIYDIRDLEGLAPEIQRELGVGVPYGVSSYNWHAFTEQCELRDLLDTVTVAHRLLTKSRSRVYDARSAARWLSEIDRIFREENVRYRLDARAGVHFSVDEEFERSRSATISSLAGRRYANVLDQFENAYTQLAETPPDGKNAIRSVFAAAEGLFRLMFTDAARLGSKEIDKYLSPLVQRAAGADATAAGASAKFVGSFKEWVNSAHFYRHEPGKEEIAQPPLPLAINIVSTGASYVRWLAELDPQSTSRA